MSIPPALSLALIVAAGTALATQAPINVALARLSASGLVAAAISFGVGFAALTALAVALGHGGGFVRAATASPVLLTGGLLGAFYVWAMITGLPALGVLTAVSALILGQLGMALFIDAVGPFGLPVREVSPTRIAAALMVAGGLMLSRF
ncbi:hypothetical protein OCGS_2400 [Oceaniovalibus guishaninsula JLT2003]|uniref:Uncharacterized protein n=1 Tax=Oceaniovalibus guishaninsula JLT2003 TaxID=1231392 RepID=K2H7S8_9RHOB|nr:DMT family transporter [Oceaniovalibus guishaninsula]EKE43668.1 hypothetical protein OCGS_2400 [Oceaniovalibus guishaninsula JLT2003]